MVAAEAGRDRGVRHVVPGPVSFLLRHYQAVDGVRGPVLAAPGAVQQCAGFQARAGRQGERACDRARQAGRQQQPATAVLPGGRRPGGLERGVAGCGPHDACRPV